jgi:hypothetical protein
MFDEVKRIRNVLYVAYGVYFLFYVHDLDYNILFNSKASDGDACTTNA